jgi:hypothetical protein
VRTLTTKCKTLKQKKKMNYLILAETEFFGLINEAGNGKNLETAYDGFVKVVISLCYEYADRSNAAIALAYAENELQHHRTQYMATEKSHTDLYVRKALAFVRKMQEHVRQNHTPVPPLSNPSHTPKEETTDVTPTLQWTGNTLDLVELIYGLNEMGCIDNGETPLKELAPALYGFFGLDTKECYRYYSAIKLRKNPSRTYFLDRMQAKLNEKIRRDEELERMRR